MYKKPLWILTLVLLAGLCACESKPSVSTPVPCAQIVRAVQEGQVFTELTELSQATALVFLDIDEDSVSEMAMAMDASRATTELIVAATAKDAAALTPLKEQFQGFLENLTDEYRAYAPAELPKLESAVLETRGQQVVLIVSPDAEKAKTALEALWKKP